MFHNQIPAEDVKIFWRGMGLSPEKQGLRSAGADREISLKVQSIGRTKLDGGWRNVKMACNQRYDEVGITV